MKLDCISAPVLDWETCSLGNLFHVHLILCSGLQCAGAASSYECALLWQKEVFAHLLQQGACTDLRTSKRSMEQGLLLVDMLASQPKHASLLADHCWLVLAIGVCIRLLHAREADWLAEHVEVSCLCVDSSASAVMSPTLEHI